MKISKGIKRISIGLAAVGIYILVAMLVNLRSKLFHGDYPMGFGFWLLISVYAMILFAYSFWISEVYVYWYGKERTWKKVCWDMAFVFFAVVPVLLLNTLLLQALVFPHAGNIFYSDYWYTDFPYFAVPLFLYTVCVYAWPASRISHLLPKYQHNLKSLLLGMWHDTFDPRYLRQYLNKVCPPGPMYIDGQVRILDILLIGYENGGCIFILTNGEKLMTQLMVKDVEQWLFRDWFFKTKRDTYVNMLYIDLPRPSDRTLVLCKSLRKELRGKALYPTIQYALILSRKMQENIVFFLRDKSRLSDTGWEEMVALYSVDR